MNLQYTGVEYHYVYLVFCAFIVWLIIPGIGLLYVNVTTLTQLSPTGTNPS